MCPITFVWVPKEGKKEGRGETGEALPGDKVKTPQLGSLSSGHAFC